MVCHFHAECKIRLAAKGLWLLLAAVSTVLFMSGLCISADSTDSAESTHSTESTQKTFASPADAFNMMVKAIKADNAKELADIFGQDEKDMFPSEKNAGQNSREWFLKAYEEKHSIETINEDWAVLYVGQENWPWPVPVVKTANNRWQFDTREGEEEIKARTIGQNEIAAIQVCLAYVDAQQEYAQSHEANGLPEYAQQFASSPGKSNGLCSEQEEAGKQSPLGPLIAGACIIDESESQPVAQPEPYHGYYYKILKKQGPEAAGGGAYDYVVNGMMIGGFALVAFPAFYNSTGIMTFIVNQDDVVYQKDLGEDTEKAAKAMTTFNPDPSWEKVE